MPGAKGRSGGCRDGSGRPPGSQNKATLVLLSEIAKRGWQLPSEFMLSVMNDPEAPLIARIMCAKGAAPYLERKLTPPMPGAIPLFREWTNEQLDDFDRRVAEDMQKYPQYYDPGSLEAMDQPCPTALQMSRGG